MSNQLYYRTDITTSDHKGLWRTHHYGITDISHISTNRVIYTDRRGIKWDVTAANIVIANYPDPETAPKMDKDFPYMDTEPEEEIAPKEEKPPEEENTPES